MSGRMPPKTLGMLDLVEMVLSQANRRHPPTALGCFQGRCDGVSTRGGGGREALPISDSAR